MLKVTYVIALAGLVISLISCSPGYVTQTSNYQQTARPPQPASNYVWIDGDWKYNRSNRTYIRRESYWSIPKNNRTYYPGRWEKNKRGNYWIPGRWK